ncbi:MAG: HTTM domain-containing protein [Bacteroidia bacterium]|nr:HTTM domain-containing protein [Bacteroidia bacterium]
MVLFVTHIRFWSNGWIETLFIKPSFFFHYNGFQWLPQVGDEELYLIFGLLIATSLFVALGLFYRLSLSIFLVLFTYVELLDATNYLNHHYLVVLLGVLLLISPAHKAFSLDVWRKPNLKRSHVASIYTFVLMAQIGVVYTFAGIAKLNPDWLFEAMPLRIWLPEHRDLPVIGGLLALPITAYVFSWFGALYDLTIFFWLTQRKTRLAAYSTVVVFHVITGILFNIGIFPVLMITSNLIFFRPELHERFYRKLGYSFNPSESPTQRLSKVLRPALMVYFTVQLLLPLRHWLYPGNVLITEEGYRFSWRVMLLEKSGLATFTVTDPKSGRSSEVDNSLYLTSFQEKQMSIQPDFILQYAHFIADQYKDRIDDPVVTVNAHVNLNGRSSKRFIDQHANLAQIETSLHSKTWVNTW